MKNVIMAGIVVGCLLLAGCFRLMPEHPEKSKQDFYKDRAMCEEKARNFTMSRLVEQTVSDEIQHAQRCMRELGWQYRFRRH